MIRVLARTIILILRTDSSSSASVVIPYHGRDVCAQQWTSVCVLTPPIPPANVSPRYANQLDGPAGNGGFKRSAGLIGARKTPKSNLWQQVAALYIVYSYTAVEP